MVFKALADKGINIEMISTSEIKISVVVDRTAQTRRSARSTRRSTWETTRGHAMGFNVCVAGATGNVGRTMISILEERNFPVDRIRLLASSRSVGKHLPFRGAEIAVEELTRIPSRRARSSSVPPAASVSKWYVPSAGESGRPGHRQHERVPDGRQTCRWSCRR